MAVALLSPDLMVNQIDWTLEQYHKLIDARILGEDDHVELLNGKIVPKYVDMPGLDKADLHFYQVSWTTEQFERMVAAGIWDEDLRIELLFGKIAYMSPVGKLHAACLAKIARYFIQNHADRFSCRQEAPITLDNQSQPQPDYVLARFREDDYAQDHPRPQEVNLLIEVADQTLARDRKEKYLAYAMAGIPEYWIVNVIDRLLEIYTEPTSEGTYLNHERVGRNQVFEHPLLGKIDLSLIIPPH